jgi:hypothetical protein
MCKERLALKAHFPTSSRAESVLKFSVELISRKDRRRFHLKTETEFSLEDAVLKTKYITDDVYHGNTIHDYLSS